MGGLAAVHDGELHVARPADLPEKDVVGAGTVSEIVDALPGAGIEILEPDRGTRGEGAVDVGQIVLEGQIVDAAFQRRVGPQLDAPTRSFTRVTSRGTTP
ncbi:hypothetical protein GCM10025880_23580 [Methylorubrum aminovorans]|nr:hypothetical protein GCM10025880_23580 [Methylorubrum aminovorans]